MSKYVIKNCPACVISPSVCSEWHIKHGGEAKDCSDITDCVMKQIVERLIKVCEEGLCSRCDGCDWENG